MTDMFKCNDCGTVFHSSEFKVVEESRGEFWGAPAFERMYYCPGCGSEDYEDLENFETEEDENDEFN